MIAGQVIVILLKWRMIADLIYTANRCRSHKRCKLQVFQRIKANFMLHRHLQQCGNHVSAKLAGREGLSTIFHQFPETRISYCAVNIFLIPKRLWYRVTLILRGSSLIVNIRNGIGRLGVPSTLDSIALQRNLKRRR